MEKQYAPNRILLTAFFAFGMLSGVGLFAILLLGAIELFCDAPDVTADTYYDIARYSLLSFLLSSVFLSFTVFVFVDREDDEQLVRRP